MKRNIILLTLVLLTIISKAQTNIAPDTINVNTAWSDTVLLNNDVFINDNITLLIKPGCVVMATGLYQIDCQGQILAQGTAQDSIKFTINDTTYFANTDTAIGGWLGIIYKQTPTTNDSSIFDYCIMEFGKANSTLLETTDGGVLFVQNFSKIRITNSYIRNNYAKCFGGAICLDYSSILINNNLFDNNYCFYDGGAISVLHKSKSVISNNIFVNNQVGVMEFHIQDTIYQGRGSGVFVGSESSDISVCNVKVINNQFYNNKGNTFYESSINSLFMNNIITNNIGEAIQGAGGPYTHSKYINNTIVNNRGHFGCAIEVMDSSLFANNIVINNLNGEEGSWDIIYNNSGWSYPNDTASNKYVKNNYVQYGDYNTGGIGNITGLTPQFINPSHNNGYISNWQDYDWHLQETSPCINMGIIDTTGLNLYEFDFDNNPRIYGNRIDIGAYENQTIVLVNKIKKNDNRNLSIYPNPAHNTLQIETSKKINNIEILDITGKILINHQGLKYFDNLSIISHINVDISTLKTGVYFIKTGNNIAKFIKD